MNEEMSRAEQLYNNIIENGETSIDSFIETREIENLFLDFKRSKNNGDSEKLESTDRNHLAKAISGFGNSEGGVIVWGIDCSKDDIGADVAKAKFPIINSKRFASLLNNVISGCTIPVHTQIQNEIVIIGKGNQGYVITLIPKSFQAPHQTIYNKTYYIRAGSSFVPTPHDVLGGMFGRRPLPNLIHQYTTSPGTTDGRYIKVEFSFILKNIGRSILSYPYMTCKIFHKGGTKSVCEFIPSGDQNWIQYKSFGIHYSAIANSNLKIPPDGMISPLSISLMIMPPFDDDILIDIIFGCEGRPSENIQIKNDRKTIQLEYDIFINKYTDGTITEKDYMDIIKRIIGFGLDLI